MATGPHAACLDRRPRRTTSTTTERPAAVVEGADLLARLRGGDAAAWEEVVERYSGLIWAIARAHRLDPTRAADVSQVTWLRLLEHVEEVRQPDRLGAWLATTARRECLRAIKLRQRDLLVGDEGELEQGVDDAGGGQGGGPGDALLDAERDAALWRAFASLRPQCQRLLRVLLADPEPSYAEVSAALDMPIGSIGPTRARCLDCLRRNKELHAVL
jgi:RNA polymerase sigma factor (sigma-70 family)